jgi:hypothetical protein
MNLKYLGRGALVVFLCVGLAMRARAENAQTVLIVVGATATAAAIAIVATVASAHHRRKKVVITGCVVPAANGMTVTDEEDKKTYALSGEVKDIKPGDRMSLEGRKVKAKDRNNPSTWTAERVIKDFGACQP